MANVVIAVIALLVVIGFIAAATRRRGPQPGEIWFVDFPYADDWTRSKDRPVLVVNVVGRTALVRKITSQDQSRRSKEYEPLPRAASGLARDSWMKKAPDSVAIRHFRRRVSTNGRRQRRAA